MSPQLPLFANEAAAALRTHVDAIVSEESRELAARLPKWIRLGTSSWTFPGWAGVLYAGTPSLRDLVEGGLAAYAEHPLLRTVGIDRSHYAPLTEAELRTYARDLAGKDVVCVSKVWEEIATYIFPGHERYGKNAGKRNPTFLNPRKFSDEILAPYMQVFASCMGPFVVEVAPIPRELLPSPHAFVAAVDAFLSAIPKGVRVAFELRNRELFSADYFRVLRAHGAGHVFNMWTATPSIAEQLHMKGSLTADFVVCRLMLPLYSRYEDLKRAYAPFNRIVVPQPEMRKDTVALILAAKSIGAKDVFVLANNKAEGSSPLTVLALAEMIARALPPGEK
jgi:uncharacterized protein YecE (DUF72 family)